MNYSVYIYLPIVIEIDKCNIIKDASKKNYVKNNFVGKIRYVLQNYKSK